MEKMKRSERVAAITRLLTREPGRLFTLREFVELFGCAKSTLSEDIATLRTVFLRYGLGRVESVNGAAGGVRFYPFNDDASDAAFLLSLCEELKNTERILEGEFIFTLDLFSNPQLLTRMGEIFARKFYDHQPDVVVTVESMGVPIALMVANALGKPLVTARRDNRITEGSVVTLNYMSASSKRVQTMSLPRRLLQEGQRALIIDDFMKGGGTAKALCAMMEEFRVEVCGIGVIISKREPKLKRVREYVPLLLMGDVNEETGAVDMEIADWLKQA
ncbi:pur operon repressor [Christensenellaceae bacterium OttesenSCG-928-L17]|nr:pur operon repressor [Christensenellaceae bacterium OttesenSCG-928-L17]